MVSARREIAVWPLTHVGQVRDHNEDSFLVDANLQLFIVADGMGGHAAGEVASQNAARIVREVILREKDALENFCESDGSAGRQAILRLLESSVQQACSSIYGMGQADDAKRGMGTTLDALLLLGNRGFIAHVGDSRVYLQRQGVLHQLTEDHSLLNELRKRGRLSDDQIAGLQNKNAITRAVGVYESVDVDTLDFDLLNGDRFLLCSDGLSGYFEEDESELQAMLSASEGPQLVQQLVDVANERGGKDNITAVLVEVPEYGDGIDQLASEVNLKLEVLHAMPLFKHLSYQELVRLLNITEIRNVTAGELLFEEGNQGAELFIVLSGKLRVERKGAIVAHLGSGEYAGEMALVDQSPRSACLLVEEDAQLMVVGRRDFFDIVRKDHSIGVKLLWSFVGVLSERLRNTSRELERSRAVRSSAPSIPPPVPAQAPPKKDTLPGSASQSKVEMPGTDLGSDG